MYPTAAEWDNLLAVLCALYRLTAAKYDRAAAEESIDQTMYGMSGQLTALTEEAAVIRLLLEQGQKDMGAIRLLLEQERQRKEPDGNRRGRRFSIHFPRISLPRPSPGWFFLPLILAALWALWFNWGVL